MKALVIERSTARFAAARVASSLSTSGPPRVGPLRLRELEPPEPPGPGWVEVLPRLSGICGSDLATIEGRASRWFEPVVSFPFVPGHEVVGEVRGGSRVVLEPVLSCAPRGVEPACPQCASGHPNRCERLAGGHLPPGLQTGYCSATGGGWSMRLVAHESQLHRVPEDWSDEAAVLVEPVACAVHGALAAPRSDGQVAVVIGAGTLGLATVAALARFRPDVRGIICAAKHPEQRRLAADLGATTVVEPSELVRAVRRRSGSWALGNGQLSGGALLVVDCVGSETSISEALAVAAPGATVVLLGMPGRLTCDLTPLWQREVRLLGAYAYGPEPAQGGRHSFELAMELVAEAELERLVSAAYPLERYAEAVEHAASAGRRGAVKVVFDLRRERRR